MPGKIRFGKIPQREKDLAKQIEALLWILETGNKLAWWRTDVKGVPYQVSPGVFRMLPSRMKGFSDYLLVVEGKVVFLEIKRPKGKQGEDQVIFQTKVERLGRAQYWLIDDVRDFSNRMKENFGLGDWSFPG